MGINSKTRVRIPSSPPECEDSGAMSEAIRKSLRVRGYPHYGVWRTRFPIHFRSFSGMHNRARKLDRTVAPEFSRTLEGFRQFVDYMGPVPSGMIRPSVGRKDHAQGYVRGNFRWQSYVENSSEAANRVKNGALRRLHLVGRDFGGLKVECFDGSRSGHTYWQCRCGCGNSVSVAGHHLVAGHTKSCGCRRGRSVAQDVGFIRYRNNPIARG
jgi:hypothetical protein